MNDLTKDELFEMLGLASNAYGIKGRTMPIIVKLQYMIDNYCELKPPSMASYCCKKCNEEWKNCECEK